MSGNPVSIQHQGYARLLSESTLQGTGTHRTSGRQAQTLQAYRTSMREDGAELRLVRRACSRLHLDQIRPHGLADRRLRLVVPRRDFEAAEGFGQIRRKGLAGVGASVSSPLSIWIMSLAS